MKYLFKEVNLNKKKEKIINIYENIIKKNNYRSKNILFLVPNSITKLNYMRDINLPFSEELKITTYSHFVQSELIKYWPIVVKNCNQIKKEKINYFHYITYIHLLVLTLRTSIVSYLLV